MGRRAHDHDRRCGDEPGQYARRCGRSSGKSAAGCAGPSDQHPNHGPGQQHYPAAGGPVSFDRLHRRGSPRVDCGRNADRGAFAGRDGECTEMGAVGHPGPRLRRRTAGGIHAQPLSHAPERAVLRAVTAIGPEAAVSVTTKVWYVRVAMRWMRGTMNRTLIAGIAVLTLGFASPLLADEPAPLPLPLK